MREVFGHQSHSGQGGGVVNGGVVGFLSAKRRVFLDKEHGQRATYLVVSHEEQQEGKFLVFA